MLAQRNAYLVRVSRTGGETDTGYSEDYDFEASDPDSDDAPGEKLWDGRAAAYWLEVRRRVNLGQTSDVILERSVILDPQLPEIEWQQDDHVQVRHGGVLKEGDVATVELRTMPGVPPSVRLTLKDS